jgi:hypothetical protein
MDEREGPRPDEEGFGEASLGEAEADNPPDDPEMIEDDADPLDTEIEDADFFIGTDELDEDDYEDEE